MDMTNMKIEISCHECVCLAICKAKTQIKCTIIVDFMDANVQYIKVSSKEAYFYGGNAVVEEAHCERISGEDPEVIWEQVHDLFQKEGIEVLIYKTGGTDIYAVRSLKEMEEEKKSRKDRRKK